MPSTCPSCGAEAAATGTDEICACCGAPLADPLIGRVVGGRYRLIARIGAGGMGAVYRAEHTMMKKELAVKFLHPELGRLEEIGRRFLREAEAASRLDHPGCIKVTDFGRNEDGALFLVMEYLAGRSLTDAIAEGPMPAARAVHVARQIADALAHAHAQGIVHRDLKPDNIMLVARDGRPDVVKILDFGIAKITQGEGAGETLTQAGVVFGTPEYLSPEQALGEDADGRADLYALGVILFEMVAGRRPFEADSKVAILSMHLTQDAPRLSEIAPVGAVTAGLDAIAARLLRKKREDRYASADEALDALTALGLPEPSRARSAVTPPPHHVPTLLAAAAAAGRVGGDVVVPPRPNEAPAGLSPPPVTRAGATSGPLAIASTRALDTPVPAQAPVPVPVAVAPQSSDPLVVVASRARAWLLPPVASGVPLWRSLRGRRLATVVGSFCALVLLLALAAHHCGRPAPGSAAAHDLTRPPPPVQPAPLAIATRLQDARDLVQRGDHRGARKILLALEKQHPESGAVHYALGNLLLADGDKSAGLDELGRAIAADGGYRGDAALLAEVTALVHDPAASQQALLLLCDRIGAPALPQIIDLAVSTDPTIREHARDTAIRLGAAGRVDRVKSYSLDLEQGKTCEDRKAAVLALRALGDKRAIPALRRARDRSGGFLGLSLYNQCIESEIVDTLKYLETLPGQ